MIQKKFYFFEMCLLFFSAQSFAMPYMPFDEYIKGATGENRELLLNFASATIKYEVFGQSCTATAVSEDGHYVGAAHCLVPCLQSKGVITSKGGLFSAETFEILSVKPQYEVLFHCSAEVKDYLGTVVAKDDLKPLAFLSQRGISDGTFGSYTGSLSMRYRKELKKILDAGYTASTAEGDMVLFRLNKFRSQKCARFSTSPDVGRIEKPGSLVSIGYPTGLKRLGNTETLMATEGEKTSGIEALPNYTYRKDSAWEYMRGYAERPNSFLASLDLVTGASGSAAIDLLSGEITGIGSFQLMGVDYFIPGNSFFVDAGTGFQVLAKSLGSKDLESINTCKGLKPKFNQ